MLIINEIKIEDRDHLEFCAMRWRVKNPQHSAQHGRKKKPEACCGNDGTQVLRDEYVRNEQIAVHLTLLSRRNGEQLATDTAAVNADESSRESPAVETRTGEASGGYAYTRTLFKAGSVAQGQRIAGRIRNSAQPKK